MFRVHLYTRLRGVPVSEIRTTLALPNARTYRSRRKLCEPRSFRSKRLSMLPSFCLVSTQAKPGLPRSPHRRPSESDSRTRFAALPNPSVR